MKMLLLLLAPLLVAGWGWGEPHQKMRLRDVEVLTLREGARTTGRRSSPVAQLACVGGSGRGRGSEPSVVQCYNRGWDGTQVQWECKADLDSGVKFGRLEVVCEGFDYPEDEFILAGSCGLEYNLELTQEGRRQEKYNGGGGGGWFSSQKVRLTVRANQGNVFMKYFQSSSYNYNSGYDSYNSKSTSGLGDLIVLVVVGIVIYAFYKTCIDSQSLGDTQYSSTDEDYRGQNPGAGGWADPNRGSHHNPGTGGFHQGGYQGNDTCGGARQRGTGAGGGGGGFWTGAATGGLLGYMFGNRGTGYGGYNRGWGGWGGGYNRGWGGWGGGYNRGWGGGGGASTGFSGGSTASSGARTASGFGGTRRR